MTFTRRRYAIMFVMTTFMIVFVVILNQTRFSESPLGTGPSVEAEENYGSENVGEDKEPEEIIERAPIFLNAWDAYNYAQNILENGKGYKSVFKREVRIPTPIGQAILTSKANNYKNSQAFVQYMENTSSAPAGLGAHIYNNIITSVAIDGQLYMRSTPNGRKYYTDDDKASVRSEEDFYNLAGIKNGDSVLIINKKSALVNFFALDKGIYTVSFTLNSLAWQNFYKSAAHGGIENPVVRSYTVTFKIDAKTGYFLSKETNGRYDGTKVIRANNCIEKITETYTSMNKNFDMVLPIMPQ